MRTDPTGLAAIATDEEAGKLWNKCGSLYWKIKAEKQLSALVCATDSPEYKSLVCELAIENLLGLYWDFFSSGCAHDTFEGEVIWGNIPRRVLERWHMLSLQDGELSVGTPILPGEPDTPEPPPLVAPLSPTSGETQRPSTLETGAMAK